MSYHDILVLTHMMFLLDELDEVVHDTVVKVLSTQMSVTSCGHNLKDTVVNGQDGHIKGSTTKIEHKDVVFATLLVQAIGDGSCCWLIDDALNCQASNDASILGGLPLSVVEVCWDCDYSVRNRLAKVCLCSTSNMDRDEKHLCVCAAVILEIGTSVVDLKMSTSVIGQLLS